MSKSRVCWPMTIDAGRGLRSLLEPEFEVVAVVADGGNWLPPPGNIGLT